MRKCYKLEKSLSLEQLIHWSSCFSTSMALVSNLDSSGIEDPYGQFDWIAAVDELDRLPVATDFFDMLDDFQAGHRDWLFGHLSYDLKNESHPGLTSQHPDQIGFPTYNFFRPRFVLTSRKGVIEIQYDPEFDDESSVRKALQQNYKRHDDEHAAIGYVDQRVDKTTYLKQAGKFIDHIQRGDIYEANYCMEFFREDVQLTPETTFLRLNEISPMPQAAFYRLSDMYLMCASPERYLSKSGNRVISQPIKGTIRRGETSEEDQVLRNKLLVDPKERAENVMITDLVRNDLSRFAKRGTVKVAEQNQLLTYKKIHQLVSTVVAEVDDKATIGQILRNSFPMGSMTGAPKWRAMEIIEELEATRRGLYSGSVGYISPENDFDFNVIIRSIQYNSTKRYLSLMTGSALTAGCRPEQEYDECLLKAMTMKSALS